MVFTLIISGFEKLTSKECLEFDINMGYKVNLKPIYPKD